MCVCVLDHGWYAFFLLKAIFESLTCCLDLWLSSLLDCTHLCVFFLFLKNWFYQTRQLLDKSSTDNYLSSALDSFSRQILSHLQSIKLFEICLDSFSIAFQSIEVFLLLTNSWQHLNRFYLSRLSARQISTDARSIELRFLYIASTRN